jgi:23S rRNA pseudouridine1911/1915/1917 synthase
MVVAKNDVTHLALAAQFANRQTEKIYWALVCGQMGVAKGEIRAAITRHPNHRQRMAVTDGAGRDAWTTYRVLARLKAASFVEARLHTGRTHQIRVHFHHIGFPVVGDSTYGKRQNKGLTEVTGYAAPRQMLHAAKLAFVHPDTGERMSFDAPLPADFRTALTTLSGDAEFELCK